MKQLSGKPHPREEGASTETAAPVAPKNTAAPSSQRQHQYQHQHQQRRPPGAAAAAAHNNNKHSAAHQHQQQHQKQQHQKQQPQQKTQGAEKSAAAVATDKNKNKAAATTSNDATATATGAEAKKGVTQSAATRKRHERRKRCHAKWLAQHQAAEKEAAAAKKQKENGGEKDEEVATATATAEGGEEATEQTADKTKPTSDDAAAEAAAEEQEPECTARFLPKTEGQRIVRAAAQAFHDRREVKQEDGAQPNNNKPPQTMEALDSQLFGTNLNFMIYVGAACVPSGSVATFSRVARYIGCPGGAGAKKVADALSRNKFDSDDFPAHRVITDECRVNSSKKMKLLKSEGVKMDAEGKISKSFIIA